MLRGPGLSMYKVSEVVWDLQASDPLSLEASEFLT